MKQNMKMTQMLKRLLLIGILAGISTVFFGCNTAHGFGKDVEKTGEKIQDKTQ